ncbi:MAG: hypothetical protein AAF316_00100 [Cyanobacteria bacterium P01_A01_bin.80]
MNSIDKANEYLKTVNTKKDKRIFNIDNFQIVINECMDGKYCFFIYRSDCKNRNRNFVRTDRYKTRIAALAQARVDIRNGEVDKYI